MKTQGSFQRRIFALFITAALILTLVPLRRAGAAGQGLMMMFTGTTTPALQQSQYIEQAQETWQDVVSFTIPAGVGEIGSAQMLLQAFDIDSPYENDRIRISNGSNHTNLGILTGIDDETTTTMLDIPKGVLLAGGAYTIQIDISEYNNGVRSYKPGFWNVSVYRIQLVLNGGGPGSVQLSATPDSGNDHKLNTNILLKDLRPEASYHIEYRLTNQTTQRQVATATSAYTAMSDTASLPQVLTANEKIKLSGNAYTVEVFVSTDEIVFTDRVVLQEALAAETPKTGDAAAEGLRIAFIALGISLAGLAIVELYRRRKAL